MNFFSVVLIFCVLVLAESNDKIEDKIIIIGAGPSGIAAATKLLENGIENILVLEAESRIGGRINTVTVDGRKIDLGAEWCHGEKGNIVYETLEKLNLLDLLQHDNELAPFYVSSKENISREFSDELMNVFLELLDPEPNSNASSMGVALETRFNEYISYKFKNDKQKLHIAQLSIDVFRHIILSLEGSFSWYDSGLDSEYLECEGDQGLGWKTTGYAIILDIMMKKYPNASEQLPLDDKILLNKEATKITYHDTLVKVSCSDNSSYTAKHVVVTPSLGVLKERAEFLFEPRLPATKIRAIRNIGMGAVLKVYVTFEDKWWNDLPGFNFIWTEADKKTSKSKFPAGPTNKKGESWIVEHYNAFVIPDSNIFLVWFTGELVPEMELMDENVLKEGIYFTFNLFLGDSFNVSRPQKLLRSNWYSNPHFRGTYSYSSVNSTAEDVRKLQSPIINLNDELVLQFAGEATSVHYHSTVHGAIESGYREAQRLIDIYKKH